jgi:Ricin-type beta-trefoil lectin domain/Putative Ig domain
MNIRKAVIVSAAVLALVAGGTAALASPGASAAGPPAPIRVNLHQAMTRALPDVRIGKRSGIIPPVGKRARPAVRTAAGCTEPNCDLVYHGGPVQHSPHVYILLWGPNWTNSDPEYGVLWYMFHGLGVTSHDAWSTITSQYGDGSGNPGFGAMVFVGAYQDTSAPPNPVTPADLGAEADALALQLGVQALADTQIVVAAQSGTCFSDGYAGNCGTPQTDPNDYCAWHSYSNEPFTNLPYQLDAGIGCGENFVNPGSAGTYDGVSLSEGHEYAETITDPLVSISYAWIDLSDPTGGEIGDKCVNDAENLTLSTSAGLLRFAMQFLWSNSAGRCVMSTDRVTVSSPGNQSSTIGAGVSLQVHASSSAGLSLSYRASGLPSGLSMSSAGLISGAPSITAGTYGVKVTATDAAGTAAGSVSFTWFVKSGTGAVKGYGSKCADDYLGRTTNGNRIDISTCNGRNGQRMTFLANGEVTVVGKCLRDSGGRVILYTCNGATTEQWTRHSNGEYVIRYNGQCLTAPSATNGTQLTLAGCTDSTHQRWSLP